MTTGGLDDVSDLLAGECDRCGNACGDRSVAGGHQADRRVRPAFGAGQASHDRSSGQKALHGVAEDLVGLGRVPTEQAGELPSIEHPHLEVGGRGHRCRAPAPRVEESDLPEVLTWTEQGERRAPRWTATCPRSMTKNSRPGAPSATSRVPDGKRTEVPSSGLVGRGRRQRWSMSIPRSVGPARDGW